MGGSALADYVGESLSTHLVETLGMTEAKLYWNEEGVWSVYYDKGEGQHLYGSYPSFQEMMDTMKGHGGIAVWAGDENTLERIRQDNAKRMREEEERGKARRAEEEPVYLDIMQNGHSLAAATLRGPGAWDIADVLCKSLASGPQFSDSFLRITSGPESRQIPLDLGGKFEEEEEEE